MVRTVVGKSFQGGGQVSTHQTKVIILILLSHVLFNVEKEMFLTI